MNAQGAPGAEKLASDRDRDRAVEVLAQAAAEGRLTMTEYSERVTSALTARTFGDIGKVTHDLPDAAAGGLPSPVQERIVALFGNDSRKGPWVVPERVSARSVLGDCHLEFQRARLTQMVTTIDATARFGSITIYVPDGVDVRLTGRAIFGAKSSKLRRRPPPGSPVLVVRCDVLFGSVTVRQPKWSMRLRRG